MAYDPTEAAVIDRIRGRAGDTSDPPALRGGEARYVALIDRHPATGTLLTLDGYEMDAAEAQATATALDALAAQYALAPKSLGSAGESISYADRAAELRATAARYRRAAELALTPAGASGYAESGYSSVRVVW